MSDLTSRQRALLLLAMIKAAETSRRFDAQMKRLLAEANRAPADLEQLRQNIERLGATRAVPER